MNLNDFAELFYTIRNDKALSGMLLARYPELGKDLAEWAKQMNRKPVSSLQIPSVDAITGLEVSIFDNWPTGRPIKHKPHRYGFSINATTAKTIDFESWPLHFSGMLLGGDQIAKKIERLQSPKRSDPISPDHAEMILTLAELLPDAQIGLLESRRHGEGTAFPNLHAFVVELEETSKGPVATEASLIVGFAKLDIQSFARTYADGTPLRGKAVLQARWGRDDLFFGWRTCSGETADVAAEPGVESASPTCGVVTTSSCPGQPLLNIPT